jgi:nitrite reductase/ring-hydroxylating ferredoxin subunit
VTTSRFPIALADERRLDRRRFLAALGTAAVAVAGGRWLARRTVERSSGTPAPVAAAADLAPGDARIVSRTGGQALVVRLRDGATRAFDRRCPHLGCPVVWAPERERIECPCHGAAFDPRTGHVLFGPPRTGLTPLPITEG